MTKVVISWSKSTRQTRASGKNSSSIAVSRLCKTIVFGASGNNEFDERCDHDILVCLEVTAKNFQEEVIDRSISVPVVIDFWAHGAARAVMLGPVLEKLAYEYDGKFVLAKIDTDPKASWPCNLAFGRSRLSLRFAAVRPLTVSWVSSPKR